jgi:hypothetical protein
MEAEHRNRLLALLEKIPHGVPAGWEKETFAVGGLMYLGFSNRQTEKLVVISSQSQCVIDCRTWEKIDCEENYDEENLVACAEPLGDELIPIAGEGGGGLRRFAPPGDGLDTAAPLWPKELVIFMPQYASWYQHPETCTLIFDDYEPLAFGFSRCGNYMAVATSSEVDIFKRTGE